MNKKRVIIVIIAVVVVFALAATSIVLLMQGNEKTKSGTVNGTIGVNTVEKPENLENTEFGIPVTVSTESVGGASTIYGDIINVINGRTITFSENENAKVTLKIYRNYADSNYQSSMNAGYNPGVVFEMTLPVTMEWNLADVLSCVDWSDHYFDGHEIETAYFCGYSENCNGSYYTSHINVHCKDTIEDHNYWFYDASISIEEK